MIAWSIEVAQTSGVFSHVVVSTEDPEIASIAIAYGAEVPFLRPVELAGDHIATRPVIKHALMKAIDLWGAINYACCLYATAPFTLPHDLRNSLATLESTSFNFAFSVASYCFPIQRALRVLPQGGVEMLQPEYSLTRSQDLENTYHDAGQFYWGRAESFLNENDIYSQESVPIHIPRHRVQDIDTSEDWHRAEIMMKVLIMIGEIDATC